MKRKNKFLVGLMALSLLGGIGSALALTRNASTASTTSAAFDQAIYLYWDSNSTTSAGMTDITKMEVNTPVYRYLTVAPKSTKSVTGTVTLTFTLSNGGDASKTFNGVTVTVYETATLLTDGTVAANIGSATQKCALTSAATSGTATFTIASAAAVHESTHYYAIKVNYDGTQQPSEKTLGGTITIAQAFAAAA